MIENEELSLLIQTASLFIVFLYAVISNNKKYCAMYTVLFMFLANILAQGIIMGGGPGFCLSFIALPFLGLSIVYVTFFIMECFGLKVDVSDKKRAGPLFKKIIKRIIGLK